MGYGLYSGKDVCQGCKASGEEKPRDFKTSLCRDCIKHLKIGKAKELEQSIEYIRVCDWHSGFASIHWSDNTLDKFANNMLKALHNAYAEFSGQVSFPRSQLHGSTHYLIPTKAHEALRDFLVALNSEVKIIAKDKSEGVKKVIEEERDKIYQAGLQKGKQLLVALNEGSISMQDFDRPIKYNEKQ